MRRTIGGVALCGVLGLGCSVYEELAVNVYGEEYIEEEIPADVFADGWTVAFEHFYVVVGDVSVAQGDAAAEVSTAEFQVFDLAAGSKGKGHALISEVVSEGAYDNTAYVVAAADDAVVAVGQEVDLELMTANGYSVYVAGKATKGSIIKTFAWGFKTRTQYEGCKSTAQIEGGKPGSVQLTIHGDHLFYDDLFAEEPAVRFDLVAQADDDGDGDGEISQAELEAVDIRPLANYQVGSADIVDLWHFIEHQTTTLGHIDGEGHCEAIREE
jgi:hypothetical protein